MLPGNDHSHEIMQSSTAFSLPYVTSPNYYRYIYPSDNAFVQSQLKHYQSIRGTKLPTEFVKKRVFSDNNTTTLFAASRDNRTVRDYLSGPPSLKLD